jgi:hypothetical protein
MHPGADAAPCHACGGLLDPADAITVDGLSFHDVCSGSERFGVPSWRADDVESLADVPHVVESALFGAIAARGLEVVGYL